MKFYVSTNINKTLTEDKYKEMLKREAKEYNKTAEEMEESDTDYIYYNIAIENFEGTLLDLDNKIIDILGDASDSIFEGDTRDYIDNWGYSYKLNDNDYLKVNFRVVEDNEDLKDIVIQVTLVELL